MLLLGDILFFLSALMNYKQLHPNSYMHKAVTPAHFIDMYLTMWGCVTKVTAHSRQWWSGIYESSMHEGVGLRIHLRQTGCKSVLC
jgi:hypothetical protein